MDFAGEQPRKRETRKLVNPAQVGLIIWCLFYLSVNGMMASRSGNWVSELRWSVVFVVLTVVGVVVIQIKGGSEQPIGVLVLDTLLPIAFFVALVLLLWSRKK